MGAPLNFFFPFFEGAGLEFLNSDNIPALSRIVAIIVILKNISFTQSGIFTYFLNVNAHSRSIFTVVLCEPVCMSSSSLKCLWMYPVDREYIFPHAPPSGGLPRR